MKIALVPNDDGLGPSAFGYYLAKTFLNRGHSLIVRNESALKSNQSFYSTEIKEGHVSIAPVYGGIKLVKTQEGGVDLEKSFQNLRKYPEHSKTYFLPEDADIVVDIGTPAAVRAAERQKKPAFTVFDHSWSKTYRMLMDKYCESTNKTFGLKNGSKMLRSLLNDSEAMKVIEEMEKDEACTRRVFLFPTCIAPDCFHEHWRNLRVTIEEIDGVLGGPRVSREEAKEIMGIDNDDPTVYICGGGTTVWDSIVPRMERELKSKTMGCNVVIFDRELAPGEYKRINERVSLGGPVEGAPIQGILPGVDLVITRAGGGIVNDSIACRVPFVCVEEPGHEQVEMIRKTCMEQRLTRTIENKRFTKESICDIIKIEVII